MWKLLRRLALATGIVGAIGAIVEWRQARLAGEVPFNRMRIAMNERVNPWLLQRGLAGGAMSEIGTLEHVGRRTGEVHRTPVHPTFVEDHVFIPLPYGAASQWARNVIAAGHCRLQLHDTVHQLDEPQIVKPAEDPRLQRPVARVADWLGIEYLRLHRFAEAHGTLAAEAEAEGPTTEPFHGTKEPLAEAPALETFEHPASAPDRELLADPLEEEPIGTA